jgi:hypothetical protein
MALLTIESFGLLIPASGRLWRSQALRSLSRCWTALINETVDGIRASANRIAKYIRNTLANVANDAAASAIPTLLP